MESNLVELKCNARCLLTSYRYPLIVSLENHCCLEQQQIIVDILKTKLGDKLYTTPINGNTFALPSPNQLKYKILIKVCWILGTEKVKCLLKTLTLVPRY